MYDYEKYSIKNLKPFGDTGWSWTIIKYDSFTHETTTEEFRTNSDGSGLFLYNGTGHQCLGTAQFFLPSDKQKAYRQLYYKFNQK